jgi:AraC-like DNA-binding protein
LWRHSGRTDRCGLASHGFFEHAVEWRRGLKVSDNASRPLFWRDAALPFIEARSVQDGRTVRYARHWHEAFSIGLISGGRCNYSNRTKTVEACVGTVVLMNPGDAHACNPVRGEPWSYRMLYIDIPWLAAIQAGAASNPSHCFLPYATIATARRDMYDGLSRLFDTLVDPQIEPLQKQSAAVSFMEIVHRTLEPGRSAPSKKVPRLARAADFIRQNCTRSLGLEEICAAASLSASHLIRAFKAVHGLTPHAYQLNCRIEFCRAQLRAGHSLAEVALAAGFSDQAHFQRSFKKYVAATPGQYRA